ncbi:hypothetical protein R8Z50_10620 [Longispora sp. K20-0274]|uniref:hypothetical protein n=1 Tax=Longispora sp. K20-0274 TaxID=3088255 RepID=UPI00399986F8
MPLLDPLTSLAPAAVATGPAGSRRIDLFFTVPQLGEMSVANLWHRWWVEGVGWRPTNGWRQRCGYWTSAVSAAAYSGGRVDVFGLGRSKTLYQTTGSGSALSGSGQWDRTSHGRPDDWNLISSPAAIALGPANFLIGVRTTRRDSQGRRYNKLWFRASEGGGELSPPTWRWKGRVAGSWPTNLASFATGLGVASRLPGSLDLFNVTRDFELIHTPYEGTPSPWGGFGQLGYEGSLTSTPSVAVWQDVRGSQMHVVSCVGPFPLEPGAVALKSWKPGWSDTKLIYTDGRTDGRGVAGPPVIVSWGKPRLDVFFLSQASPVGGGLGITHGVSANGRSWDFSEILPIPNF